MAKKEQKGTEATETPKVEAQTEQETPETYSAEREAKLVTEYEAKIEEARETGGRETYSKLNPKISQLTQENASLKRQPTSTSSISAAEAVLTAMEAGQGEYGDNPKIQAAKVVIAQEKQREALAQAEATRTSQYNEWVTYADGEKTKMEQRIKDAGFDPSNDDFDRVWDAWLIGKTSSGQEGFDLANTRLERITKKSKPEEKSEEEVARAYLEKTGRLKTETGLPSGGVSNIPTDKTKLGQWVKDLPLDEYEKLKPEIDKMLEEGKIK